MPLWFWPTHFGRVLGRPRPGLAEISRSFGLIWATLVIGAGMMANVGLAKVLGLYANDPAAAAALWEIVELVENGIGGGNEVVGGAWAVAIGLAALAGALPRVFGVFSMIVGIAGLLTVLPPLSEVGGAIFGLGYIAWFIWVGIILIRARPA